MSFDLVVHALIGFTAFGLACVIGGGAAYAGAWAVRNTRRANRR